MENDAKKTPTSGRKVFGPYEIIRRLGKGGMGEVYEAYEKSLDRTVALKIITRELSKDDLFRARFLAEAKIAAKLEHNNIVSVHAAGEINGICYIAMPYIKGKTLHELIAGGKVIQPDKALDIIRQSALALAEAQRKGIVHRDVKPANIMLTDDGAVKIMDFGLAKETRSNIKLTDTGAYLGTPEYSSPEQCEGAELSGKTDVYSLGVVLYEMLTGKVPHSAETPYNLFKMIINDRPTNPRKLNPSIPLPVTELLNSMLEKDQHDRPNAEELAEAVNAVIQGRQMVLKPKRQRKTTRPVPAAPARARISGAQYLAMGTVVLVAVIAAIYFMGGKETPVKPPAPAKQAQPVLAQKPADKFPKGLVILDSKNITGDRSMDWLKTAVPELLMTDLSDCAFLRIISRDELKTRLADPKKSVEYGDMSAEVKKKLDIDLAVTSTFMKTDGKVVIDVKVIDCFDGAVVSAQRSESDESKILVLIDELSGKITDSIAKKFDPDMLAFNDKPLTNKLFESMNKAESNSVQMEKGSIAMDDSSPEKALALQSIKDYYASLAEYEEGTLLAMDDVALRGESMKGMALSKEKALETDKLPTAGEGSAKVAAASSIPAPGTVSPTPPAAPMTAMESDDVQPFEVAEATGSGQDAQLSANSDAKGDIGGSELIDKTKANNAEPGFGDPALNQVDIMIARLERILQANPTFAPARKKLDELKARKAAKAAEPVVPSEQK